MAHYAELGEEEYNADLSATVRPVLRVIVVDDAVEPREGHGVAWCFNWNGGGHWAKCSYNATIRKNFPGIGHLYDAVRDAYIEPKPKGGTYKLNEATCRWEADE